MKKPACPVANKAPARYAALLRGVNVGGANKIAMASLADLFLQAGCRNVQTYIQSGNVVFAAQPKVALAAVSAVCSAVQQQFGFQTQIVLRSLEEMERIAASHPFFRDDEELGKFHVVFLADAPSPERIAALDPQRSPPDQFKVLGKEVYLYMPNGMARTKLSNAYFDSKLKTVSTVRNWRTVQKLLELMRGV